MPFTQLPVVDAFLALVEAIKCSAGYSPAGATQPGLTLCHASLLHRLLRLTLALHNGRGYLLAVETKRDFYTLLSSVHRCGPG